MKDRKGENRFSRDAVRDLAADAGSSKPAEKAKLSPVAYQIASQYARNSNSPVMISGIMRIVEFLIILLTGMTVFLMYVGLQRGAIFSYFSAVLVTAIVGVLVLELTDSYQLAVMRNPFTRFGRLLMAWSGTFALMALAAFFLKISEAYSRVWLGT